jgi:hypothetical protein
LVAPPTACGPYSDSPISGDLDDILSQHFIHS